MKKINNIRIWQIISAILLLIVLIGAFGFRGGTISEKSASTKIVEYLNSLTEGGISFVDSQDLGNLYKITVLYEGQNIPVYITKDGEYFIQEISPLISQPTQISQQQTQQVQQGQRVNVEESQIENYAYLGDKDAPVTIIEFTDFSCPFCQRHYLQTKPLIKENYIDKGLVKHIFADFVGVGTSTPHEAALCVRELNGDEAFWEMFGLILENQQEVRSNPSLLSGLAVQTGADETSFNECLNSGKYKTQVSQSTSFGQSLGITGTPGFLIGNSEQGYKLISGAQQYDVFQQAIEGVLAR